MRRRWRAPRAWTGRPGLAGGRSERSTPLPPMATAARTSSSSPASCCGCKTPNELIGVMAHETGHIAAGHLSRGSYGMKKAMIPMLLSHGGGHRRDDRGRGRSRHGDHGRRPGLAMGQMAAFTRVQESTADQIAPSCCWPRTSRRWACTTPSSASRTKRRRAPTRWTSSPWTIRSGQDRVFDLQDMVEASPYREVQDSPEALHTFQMVQAKLAGFVLPVKEALNRYPECDTSRAGALCPRHDLSAPAQSAEGAGRRSTA